MTVLTSSSSTVRILSRLLMTCSCTQVPPLQLTFQVFASVCHNALLTS